MCDPFDVCPRDDEPGHGKRYLGQEVGVKLALTVDGDHVCILYLEYYAEYRSWGREIEGKESSA